MTRSILQSQSVSERVTLPSILGVAAAFGLTTGLLEGIGLLIFRGYGWGNSRIPEGVSAEILGVSPVVNLGLFLLVGVLLCLAHRILPRFSLLRASLFCFSFLMFVDLLGVSGRIGVLGILVFAAGLSTFVARRLQVNGEGAMRLAPRIAVGLAAIALVALLGVESGERWKESQAAKQLPAASASLPNVLWIVVDTLRADHLSTYGYARSTSPKLEALAQSGVLFENAISASSWTLPAHESLLSGRYPHEHGPLREQVVNHNLPSIGRILAAKGYRTGAFSANTDFFCRRAGFDKDFLHFEDYFYSAGDAVYRTFWGRLFYRTYVAGLLGVDELPARKTAAQVNNEVLRWIDGGRDRPFFAVLNYFDLHYPYVPSAPYRTRFTDRAQQAKCVPGLASRLNPLHRPTEFELLMAMTPECFQIQVDQYDGAISYVDDQIAALMSDLGRRGLGQNTIVVITADHGESFREHGLVTHGTSLYRELIHVPLVILWPNHVPAGKRIDRPVSTASLPATVLDLLGDESEQQFPIPSLARSWAEPATDSSWPDPVSEMAQDLYVPSKYPAYRGWLKSITDSQWHLIVSQADPSELYEWQRDPAESQNVAESLQGKTVLTTIGSKLWDQVTPPSRTKANANPAPQPNQMASTRQ